MDSEDLVALIQGAQLDDRMTLEQRAAAKAGISRRSALLDQAAKDVVKAWTVAAGGPRTAIEDQAALARIAVLVRGMISKALGGLGADAAGAVRRLLPSAVQLGIRHAIAAWRGQGGGPLADLGRGSVPGALLKDAAAIPGDVSAVQRAAALLLKPALLRSLGLPAALAPLQKARGALDLVNAAMSRIIGGGLAHGGDRVSAAAGAPFEVWIAERDACARCQALSGHVVAAGSPFPGGLSLDPAQAVKGAKPVKPPLHPHCRCKLVPYDPANHPPGAVTLPEAARREALRSAVGGFSLPSESNASRLRAAEFAIQQAKPGDLPKSVIAYGRSAVRQGRFPRGRDVPNGPAS